MSSNGKKKRTGRLRMRLRLDEDSDPLKDVPDEKDSDNNDDNNDDNNGDDKKIKSILKKPETTSEDKEEKKSVARISPRKSLSRKRVSSSRRRSPVKIEVDDNDDDEEIEVEVNKRLAESDDAPSPSDGSSLGNTSKFKDMVRPEEADSALIKLGYIPLNHYRIKTQEGTITYIKARSPMGFMIFVDVSDFKYIANHEDDLELEEMLIPVLPKDSNTKVRGIVSNYRELDVAILTNNGICKIERTSMSFGHNERHFHIVSDTENVNASLDDDLISFPIIRFNHIEENPEGVMKICILATMQNRKNAVRECEMIETDLIAAANELGAKINEFGAIKEERFADLREILRILSDRKETLMTKKRKSKKEAIEEKEAEYNLADRNDACVALIQLHKSLIPITKEIDDLSLRLTNIISTLNSFQNLKVIEKLN